LKTRHLVSFAAAFALMAGLAGEASAQTLPEDSLFRLPSVGI